MADHTTTDAEEQQAPTGQEEPQDAQGQQTPPEGGEHPQDTTEQQETPDTSKGNPEAAKYRTRLRETEGERDQLKQQVQNLQRAQVEALSGLEKPGAIWAAGVDLGDLLHDDGTVDPARVAQAAQQAHEQLGAAQQTGTVFDSPAAHRPTGGYKGSVHQQFTAAFAPPEDR